MPTGKSKALLIDIGTEEMTHLEVIAAMVYQLMKGASVEEIKAAGLVPTTLNMTKLYSMSTVKVYLGLPPIYRGNCPLPALW